jgi:MFS family permease
MSTNVILMNVTPSSSSTNSSANSNIGLFGVYSLFHLSLDGWLLFFSKTIRMFSYGFLAVMLVIYLQEVGFTDDSIGLLFTLTLLGDALISIVLTTHADSWGRRRTLLIGSALAILTSIMFATQSNFYLLLISGIIGVISPSGYEIGPFMAIELSALSEVTSASSRTSILAWYNLGGSFASAAGALTCGFLLSWLQRSSFSQAGSTSLESACRSILLIYAGIQGIQAFSFVFLSSAIEVSAETKRHTQVRSVPLFMGLHKSLFVVMQLSLLFMLDAFAGSFVLQSIISAWFYAIYHTPTPTLGEIVFYCNILAGISALFAAEISRLIGLVETMVVTHLPSNILLILVPLMPSQTLAMLMLGARYCISQMDVPTRNAYVQSVVDADERSAANGVTNVIRSIGASSGPFLSGLLMASTSYRNYPFYIAGGLKIVYDLLLLFCFVYGTGSDLNKSTVNTQINDRQQEEQIELLSSHVNSPVLQKDNNNV